MTERHTDLCKCDWKEKIEAMWRRLQETIKGVRLDGERVWPDGDGIIDLTSGTSRWGAITGEIQDQEDLQAEFNTKQGKLTAGSNISISATNVISASVPNPSWGHITGDLPDQTDLMTVLDGKQPLLTAGTGITIDTDHVIASTVPVVSVSESGSATDAIQYITVGGVEHKIAGGGGSSQWGQITGNIQNQTDLQAQFATTQGKLTAGANITITPDNVISASGSIGTNWGNIGGDIQNQTDLQTEFGGKQNRLTAGTGITIVNDVISATPQPAAWGQITGDIQTQADLQSQFGGKQDRLTAGRGIQISAMNEISSNVPIVSVQESGTATDAIKYITIDGVQHRIDAGAPAVSWGQITGTLAAQVDLQTALDLKLNAAKISHEVWTFVLDDETTVTKDVALYVS